MGVFLFLSRWRGGVVIELIADLVNIGVLGQVRTKTLFVTTLQVISYFFSSFHFLPNNYKPKTER